MAGVFSFGVVDSEELLQFDEFVIAGEKLASSDVLCRLEHELDACLDLVLYFRDGEKWGSES